MIKPMSPKKIDTEAIEQIAASASLELSEKAQAELTSDLGKMIELFIAMDKIEVCPTKKTDVNTTTYKALRNHIDPNETIIKTKGPCYTHYNEESGYFVVPKVLNNET